MEREQIKELVGNIVDSNYYDANSEISNYITNKVEEKGLDYIKSGDAFKSYLNRDVNESKLDYESIAVKIYKKYKGNIKDSEKYCNANYSNEDCVKIMKYINKI